MALEYRHLDHVTRQLMLAEIANDIGTNQLYFSPRLSQLGIGGWAALLAEAARDNHDGWLALEIQRRRFLNAMEQRRHSNGNVTMAKVPVTAHETLAEGEFNRFYMRAICLRALETNGQPIVFRARFSRTPRPESERLIGQPFEPDALLAQLRAIPSTDQALGMPPGPNSGLSIHLPER
ncbi:hypothetical protein PQR05_24320 [Paraburkholderia sediminicola]|uniref:hypothetical protein n=1 Tax=Paraburkholderia sediminicola TaxID=458836 RepID=UPI0038B7B014